MCKSGTAGRQLIEWVENPLRFQEVHLLRDIYKGEQCLIVRLYPTIRNGDEFYEGRSSLNNFSDAWAKAKAKYHDSIKVKRIQKNENTPIGQLDKKMRIAISELRFEDAAQLRHQIDHFFDDELVS